MNTLFASRLTTRVLADNRTAAKPARNRYWVALGAALMTTATLTMLTVGGANANNAPERINGISVVDLPAIEVYAEAAMQQGLTTVTLATVNVYADAMQDSVADTASTGDFVQRSLAPQLQRMGSAGLAEGFSLLNSQLAMPYYSFGKGPSSISKE